MPSSIVVAIGVYEAYEADLIKKRQYLDGAIDSDANTSDDTSPRLNAEAFNQNDSETLGLLCPVAPETLLWVASLWNDRNIYAEGY